MAKMKFADAMKRLSALERENTVMLLTVNSLASGKIDATISHAPFKAKLMRSTGAHGGIVAVGFCPRGQSPYWTAHYTEDWLAATREPFRCGGIGNDPEQQALMQLMTDIRDTRDSLVREECAREDAATKAREQQASAGAVATATF